MSLCLHYVCMIGFQFNWRWLLALLGNCHCYAVPFSIHITWPRKSAKEEQTKSEQWVAASKAILNHRCIYPAQSDPSTNNMLFPLLKQMKTTVSPVILNLDTVKIASDKNYLSKQLKAFKFAKSHPLEIKWSDSPYTANRYYYGDIGILNQVRYYPLIQLLIVAVLIFFIVYCNFFCKTGYPKPGMGRHGQGNSPSAGNTLIFTAGLDRNAERNRVHPGETMYQNCKRILTG